jgi:hypothetical protein
MFVPPFFKGAAAGGRQQLIGARKGEKVDRDQKANDVPEVVNSY